MYITTSIPPNSRRTTRSAEMPCPQLCMRSYCLVDACYDSVRACLATILPTDDAPLLSKHEVPDRCSSTGPCITPMCGSRKYRPYSSNRHYSAFYRYCLFPRIPSRFTGAIMVNWYSGTSTKEGTLLYFTIINAFFNLFVLSKIPRQWNR